MPLSDHSGVKLETNNTDIAGKSQNIYVIKEHTSK
jgi:hypothetical protein